MTTNNLESTQSKIDSPPKWTALILLAVALIALSLTAIFIKISVQEISANATVFNRLWIATIIFGLWNGFKQLQNKELDEPSATNSRYQISEIMLLLGVAIVHVMGRFLWTWSLTQTNAANATVLSNMPPLFTALGGWLFFGQRFDRRFVFGLGIALAGAIGLGLEDFFLSDNSLFSETAFIGDAAALLSAMFYAASFLILEQLRSRLAVQNILLWRCLLGTLFMIPVVLMVEDQVFPISWQGWLAVFGLAAICEGLGHGLIVYSLKYFSSAFVTVVLLLEPVMTAVFAWILFSEGLSLLNLLAFAVILEGIYLAKTGKGADKA
ncbi:DMT family transporter [Coleofasciculus chthonoplastes]|uniref:DMT family transporter n=1 Tax=Coleofasciculus chthonoplastes TaxID=64178 RepID=UPI0033028D6C